MRKYSGACLPDSSGAPPSNSSKPNSPLFCEQFAFQWWWWGLWWGWPMVMLMTRRSWCLVTAARATLLKLFKKFGVMWALSAFPAFCETGHRSFYQPGQSGTIFWLLSEIQLAPVWSWTISEYLPHKIPNKIQRKRQRHVQKLFQVLLARAALNFFQTCTSTSTSRPSRSTVWQLHFRPSLVSNT